MTVSDVIPAMSLPSEATHIVLAQRPKGFIDSSNFSLKTVPIPQQLEPNHVLVRVDWISLDPAMRGWINDRETYVPPVGIGETMRAFALGTVIKASAGGPVNVGDTVTGSFGWCNYAIASVNAVQKVSPVGAATELDFMGVLGMTGLTAYFGLLDVGKLKEGDTLVVSGAAGAVGSMACQIGKIKGARVIGLAGTPEKVAWLEGELGIDKALNYKSPTFAEDFKQHVGQLDVFFDNVGGDILDLCLKHAKQGARMAICGGISLYNDQKPKPLYHIMNLVIKRIKMEGFIIFDYAAQFPAAIAEMSRWLGEGKLKRRFTIVEGLEKCPEYVNMLYKGENTGKLMVKISQEAKHEL